MRPHSDEFPECAEEFRQAYQAALPVFSKNEIEKWIDYGQQIHSLFPSQINLLKAFFKGSPAFFSERAFGSMGGWLAETVKIGDISTDSARRFMENTPAFIEFNGVLHLRDWAGMVRDILVIDPGADGVVQSFLESGNRLTEHVTYRIYQVWYNSGIRLMRMSPTMAEIYFAAVTAELLRLYQTEMRKIFELTALIGRELPGKAVEFVQSVPVKLLRLNPNVRERVLDVTRSLSEKRPAAVQGFFSRISEGLERLSYPDQETVIRHEAEIGSISKSAATVYFDNASSLLHSVQPAFFDVWVSKACRLLSRSESEGTDYLDLKSSTAQSDLKRWQEAVFLEDNERLLSAYARSLCGAGIYLKPVADEAGNPAAGFDQTPDESGRVLFLPLYIADEERAADNFRIYKAAVAHHAGYIEFGTFGPGYGEIMEGFAAFPQSELIRDIFFILENGRIDRCLRREYQGLSSDLDQVLCNQMRKRTFPEDSPLHTGLECLLRLVYQRLPESAIPTGFRELVEAFQATISGLYNLDTGISQVFLGAVEIYHVIKPLISAQPYLSFEAFDYLEMPEMEMLREGRGEEVGDELKNSEDDDGFGVELSEEEMERLKELLQEIAVLEPIRKGQGGKGFVIEGLTAQVAGELEELADDEPRPEEKIVVAGGLQPLVTRVGPFFYDEWDYLQKGYRNKWCCLREVQVEPAETGLYEKIYSEYSRLIYDVKRQFQRIRPEELERVKRLEWGTEIDFNAMIQNVVDRRTGDTPSDRIFSRREKKRRRISTFLLIDMSASTDRLASSLMADSADSNHNHADNEKRIIDIEIESLVVMAEALESLDDSYAIFGFSGYGREQVELFSIKDFSDPYSGEIKNRICGIQPRKSTRMGPAIRHASARLKETDSDYQLLIMLSDGYPQDMNYGEDRTSQTYALHDTMMALIEAKRAGIRPFCITIDRCGDDYLKQMIDPGSYLVIEDIYSLPSVLPRVVESLMG